MTRNTDDLFDDEVTTGATLDSGTTIGGNKVYHLGNDGEGSGLDVETVDGNEPVMKGKQYKKSKNIATIQTISPPSNETRGIGITSNNSLWFADNGEAGNPSIFELNQSGTQQTSFSTIDVMSDVGEDSFDSIWAVNRGSNNVRKYNQSGTEQTIFSSPSTRSRGVDVDNNTGCVWMALQTSGAESIYKSNQSGTVQSSFDAGVIADNFGPDSLSVQSNGCLWISGNEVILKSDQSGSIENIGTAPTFINGIGIEGSSTVWTCIPSDNECIYELSVNTRLEKL